MKTYCLILVSFFLTVLGIAQEDTTSKKKFILASVSVEMGPMMDKYSNIDLDLMYDLTSNPSDIERDLTGHNALYDHNVEGSRIGASIALIPFSKKENDYSSRSEIRLGLFYKVRGTYLSYSLTNESGAYKAVGYSTKFKELALHGAYVWKYNPKFAKRFTLSAGIGLGLGSTFSDKTSVAEIISSGQPAEVPNSFFEVYQGKSSLFVRPFAPIGIDYAVSDRFDVGIQSNFGVALQQIYGGENYFIPIFGSIGVRVSYFF